MALNDKEFHIITAKIMFKHDFKLALAWLKGKGYEVKQADYYRTLQILDDSARKRLLEVAQKFEILAADEIDKFKLIEKEMWVNYHREQAPRNKAVILKMIYEMQPYITALYTEIKKLFQKDIEDETNNVFSKFREFTTTS